MKLYILEVGGSGDYSVITFEEDYQIEDFDKNDILFNTAGSYPSHKIEIPLECGENFTATIETIDLGDVNKEELKTVLYSVYNFFYDEDESKERDLFFRFSDEWQPNVKYDPNDETFYEVNSFN